LWKNRNKKVGLCVMVVTTFFILVALWAILATPGTALAKKPSGGGGDGGNDPTCFELDFDGGGVWSDRLGDYCNNKKAKVEAIMNSNGGVKLATNTVAHRDPEAGRTFFVDLGQDIELNGADYTISTTQGLPGFINRTEGFELLGGGVDLRAMNIGDVSHNANLVIDVSLLYPGGETGVTLTISYWPEAQPYGCDGTNSTQVTVTRISPTEWDITNVSDVSGTPSKAILHERLITPGGGSLDEWCRSEILTLPLFTVTVKLQ